MAGSDQILAELLNNESFVRWINETANQQEQLEWEQWEQESLSHTELRRKANLLYNLPLEVTEGKDIEEQLDRIHKRIDDNEKIVRLLSRRKRKNIGYYGAVATALVLLLAVGGMLSFYYQEQLEKKISQPLYTTIEVGYGERGSLKISDGSSIQLNANSTLRYSPEQFNTSMVEVWLEGEAYFSIIRDPESRERAFIVHTPDGDIRVLGTRFNVNTRFRRTGVVLEEGSIEVLLKDSLQNVKAQHHIKPGQRAEFSFNQANIRVQQVDTLFYTAWLNGKLVFKDTPLKEVVQHIEEYYGVSFTVKYSALLDEKISGSIQNPNLETLLKGMEEVLNLNIQQKAEDEFLILRQDSFQKE